MGLIDCLPPGVPPSVPMYFLSRVSHGIQMPYLERDQGGHGIWQRAREAKQSKIQLRYHTPELADDTVPS